MEAMEQLTKLKACALVSIHKPSMLHLQLHCDLPHLTSHHLKLHALYPKTWCPLYHWGEPPKSRHSHIQELQSQH
jgi:hypothetical protein